MHLLCLLILRLADVYLVIVIAGVIASWVQVSPDHPVLRAIRACTEPVYGLIRRLLPLQWGSIDFSPIILVLLITLLQRVVLHLDASTE